MRALRNVVLFSLVLGFADVQQRPGEQKLELPAKAEDLSGAYSYKGVEKGEAYQGVLTLVGEPPRYRAIWVSDDGDVFRGTALHDEDVLAVGWAFSLGVHPAQGTVLKQGVMLFRRDGDSWRGKWTTGERVSFEDWRRIGVAK